MDDSSQLGDGGQFGASSVWMWAATPWHEALAIEPAESGTSPRNARRSIWHVLLAWLTEYHRY